MFNHNEAIDQLFDNLEGDSALNAQFPNLRQRFRDYFADISDKKFTMLYQDNENQQKHEIRYSKNELLDAVFDRMNNSGVKTVPEVILNLVNGDHEKYVQEVLNGKFAVNKRLSYGMRLSVYCSEQIAYSDKEMIKEQDKIVPWLTGYPFNNVNHQICDC